MRTTRKRIVAFALCILMAFGVFTISVSAKVYSGSCGKDGDNVRWTCDSSTNTLTISGTGEMAAYYRSSLAPWNFDKIHCVINTIVIEDGVTNISENAFSTNVDFRRMIIGKDVARIDSDLLSDDIKSFSVSQDNAFFCSVADVLYNKDKTELIRYPVNSDRFTTYQILDGVRIIRSKAFYESCYLDTVSIPTSVEQIGEDAFFGMTTLPEFHHGLKEIIVDVGNAKYSSDAQGVLYDKENKALVRFPPENEKKSYTVQEGTKQISSRAFSHCNYLKSICLPDSVTSIDMYAFCYCENLAFVHIPAGVQEIKRAVFSDSFNGYICSETENCVAKQYAQENNIRFRTCNGHGAAGDALVVSVQPVVCFTPIIGGEQIYTNKYPMISTQRVNVNISSDDIQSVEWTSSDNSIVRVKRTYNGGCLVRTGRSGTATVTCTVTDNQGNMATDACEITVQYTPIVYWIRYLLNKLGWI